MLPGMVNAFEKPDDFIPDEPATFSIPPEPVPPPKTMLEQLWEEEPFPDIPGPEPEEEEYFVKEVHHQEGLRLLSANLDEYIKQFREGLPFVDITTPFYLVGEDGSIYYYTRHNDIFAFNLAVAYCCMRLQYGDEVIPSFYNFYRKMNKLITHSSEYGEQLRCIVTKVQELVTANQIRNIHDLMRAYTELYLAL